MADDITTEQATRWFNAATKLVRADARNMQLVAASLTDIMSGHPPKETRSRVKIASRGAVSPDQKAFHNKRATQVSFGGLPEMVYVDEVPLDHVGMFDTYPDVQDMPHLRGASDGPVVAIPGQGERRTPRASVRRGRPRTGRYRLSVGHVERHPDAVFLDQYGLTSCHSCARMRP